MSKLLNWIFGSFFRTLGRLFAIFFVGILLIFIGSKIGLRFPKNIFMKVNAETFSAINVDSFAGNNVCVTDSYSAQGCSPASRNIPFFYSYEMVSDNFTKLFYFDSNQKEFPLGNNASYAIIPVYIKSNEDFKFVSNYSPSNQQITSNMIDFNLSIWNSTPNWSEWFTCDLLQHDDNSNYYYYRCPVKNSIHAIRTSVNFIYANTNLVQTTPTIKVGIGELWSLALDNSASIESALNESKQNTESIKNSTNDIKDSINNSNVDESSSTASGFFDNFSDNDHGLSSIITAPLRAINAMLSNQCVAPGATYKGQSFSLPCGSMLWDRPGGNDFKNFINIFYGGFLAYFVIRRLFLDIEKLKNPNNDKVEVEKL